MKSLLAVLMLAAPLAAQGPDPGEQRPDSGQFARVRLAAMYPRLARETTHPQTSDPNARLMNYLQDSAPVLKNIEGLVAYLRAGLLEPLGIGSPNAQWDAAWTRLGKDMDVLKALTAEGAEIGKFQKLPAQSRVASMKISIPAAFSSDFVDRIPKYADQKKRLNETLQRFLVGYAQRETLIEKSREAAQDARQGSAKERVEAESGKPLP